MVEIGFCFVCARNFTFKIRACNRREIIFEISCAIQAPPPFSGRIKNSCRSLWRHFISFQQKFPSVPRSGLSSDMEILN